MSESLRSALAELVKAAHDDADSQHGTDLGHGTSGFEQACPMCWADAISRLLAAHPPERPLFDRDQGDTITRLLGEHSSNPREDG